MLKTNSSLHNIMYKVFTIVFFLHKKKSWNKSIY